MFIKQTKLIDKLSNLTDKYANNMTVKDLRKYFSIKKKLDNLYIEILNKEK